MLVVGEKEQTAGTVAVRDRVDGDLGAMPVAELRRRLEDEVRDRRIRQVSTCQRGPRGQRSEVWGVKPRRKVPSEHGRLVLALASASKGEERARYFALAGPCFAPLLIPCLAALRPPQVHVHDPDLEVPKRSKAGGEPQVRVHDADLEEAEA